jgi:hypothetical protein
MHVNHVLNVPKHVIKKDPIEHKTKETKLSFSSPLLFIQLTQIVFLHHNWLSLPWHCTLKSPSSLLSIVV